MPTPPKVITLGAKDTLITPGTTVIFRNLTRQGKVTQEGVGGEAVTTGSNWKEGDKISVEVFGRYSVSTVVTVNRGGIKASSLSLSEDTSTPGIDL